MIADKGIEYQGMKLARTIGLFDEVCAKLKAKSDEIKLVMFGSDEQIVKYYQNYGQSVDQSYSAAWEMLNEINTVKTKKKEAQEKKANTKAKAKTAKFDKVADIVDMHGEVLA